jgi:outer membrane lipoprotein-sorting protein
MHRRSKFILSLTLLLFCITSHKLSAQHSGYTPVADLAAFKKKFAFESGKVMSITSDFTQDKTLTALTEKITSTGKFWFKRNNRVRIEYLKPFSYLMIMNGDKIYVRDNQKENTINVKSNKLFQQVNRIMIDCVQGTILDSRDFTTKVFEGEQVYLLEMTPSSRTLRDFFETILLRVEKSNFSVKSIEMNEPAGDQTIISFRNKKLNEQVPDAVFAL